MPHGYFADRNRTYGSADSYTPDSKATRPPDRPHERVGSAIIDLAIVTTEQSESGEI